MQLATLRTQLSMVMAFVPDASGALAAFLDRGDEPPWLTVEDGRGVMNRLWREQDPTLHVQLAEALRGEIAVIDDVLVEPAVDVVLLRKEVEAYVKGLGINDLRNN